MAVSAGEPRRRPLDRAGLPDRPARDHPSALPHPALPGLRLGQGLPYRPSALPHPALPGLRLGQGRPYRPLPLPDLGAQGRLSPRRRGLAAPIHPPVPALPAGRTGPVVRVDPGAQGLLSRPLAPADRRNRRNPPVLLGRAIPLDPVVLSDRQVHRNPSDLARLAAPSDRAIPWVRAVRRRP